uniref:Reverse transcriptase domain-containing protein n=1 Tax=Rhizophora mucronata TaxID=61149 RepID=A0A2P2NN93_RHIMU
MNDIFRLCLHKFVLTFFDDILVYSFSLKAYLLHLQTMFITLHENFLFVKKTKCSFAS